MPADPRRGLPAQPPGHRKAPETVLLPVSISYDHVPEQAERSIERAGRRPQAADAAPRSPGLDRRGSCAAGSSSAASTSACGHPADRPGPGQRRTRAWRDDVDRRSCASRGMATTTHHLRCLPGAERAARRRPRRGLAGARGRSGGAGAFSRCRIASSDVSGRRSSAACATTSLHLFYPEAALALRRESRRGEPHADATADRARAIPWIPRRTPSPIRACARCSARLFEPVCRDARRHGAHAWLARPPGGRGAVGSRPTRRRPPGVSAGRMLRRGGGRLRRADANAAACVQRDEAGGAWTPGGPTPASWRSHAGPCASGWTRKLGRRDVSESRVAESAAVVS